MLVDSEDAVKFPSLPELPDIEQTTPMMPDSNAQQQGFKDETLLLFDCMPKGLESFLETGPSRRVVDYMDYEKLCHIQKKKIQYLTEQQVPQANRAKDIHEKSLELQEHLKNFDVFVSDAQKKMSRAKEYYASCKNTNKELDVEIPKAIKRLAKIKVIRDDLMSKVIKYQPVEEFIDSIIRVPDSQFINFNAIMDRNSTLHLTNKYLTKRFTERHLVEKKLNEELQATANAAKTHDIFIRREINVLKKELQKLTRENIDLEQKCMKWAETTNEKLAQVFEMTTSIRNMAKIIMEVRPFTVKRLAHLTNPSEMIEKVGLFITDYTDIINTFGVNEHKVKPNKKERRMTSYGEK